MSTELPENPQQPPAEQPIPTPEPQPAAAPPPPAASGSPSADERLWGMLSHLSGILFWFLGPLVIWLVQKDKMPFVDDQGKEALNFEITMAIAWVAVGIGLSVLGAILAIANLGFIAAFLMILYPALGIYNLAMLIIAGLKANEGVAYRYPVSLRLVK